MSHQFHRRRFLSISSKSVFSLALPSCLIQAKNAVADALNDFPLTPGQSEGPFYPLLEQVDKDTDLTHVKGHAEAALGKPIQVLGRITDEAGAAISNAKVEIWQANAAGRYQHKRDHNHAALDPNFQGWGISRSSKQGEYRFISVFPGSYPASPDWTRPPHIHFKVAKSGYDHLTTQMYFPGQALNNTDLILNSLSNRNLPLLVAKQNNRSLLEFVFDIVLRSV